MPLRGATRAPPVPTAAGTGLAFEHIGMVFPDGTQAIADVTFAVRPGEFVTVVGPSGCGKSTLLRIASGLLRQTSGEAHIDREHLGYVSDVRDEFGNACRS